MTDLERLLDAYPGTHVVFQGDLPVWSLCRVDLEKRTAYVANGNYWIEWDDTDMYFRHDHRDKLNWMFEIGPEFRIVPVEVTHEDVG